MKRVEHFHTVGDQRLGGRKLATLVAKHLILSLVDREESVVQC
jgi:hypothetical protein